MAFILSLLIVLAGFGYIIFFQIKLIQKSKGKIKKRLSLTLLGESLFMISIILSRDASTVFLLRSYAVYFLLVSAPISLFSLTIIFLGIFKFPAFLEFDWQNDLIGFYIVNKDDLYEIYSFNFLGTGDALKTDEKEVIKKKERELMLPKAVMGINEVFSIITNTANENLKKIQQENFFLLMEYSDLPGIHLAFTLLTKKDSKSAIYFLNMLKNQFLTDYANILINVSKYKDTIQEVFSSFDVSIEDLLK